LTTCVAKADWDRLWQGGFDYQPLTGWERSVFAELAVLLAERARDGLNMLSVGCGRAVIDYWLHVVFGERVTALDTSSTCLRQIRQKQCAGLLCVQADAMRLPFGERAFSVVHNEGLLEHFPDEEVGPLVAELARCTDQCLLLVQPYAGCRPYILAKTWLEQNNRWQWGYEQPRTTLAGWVEPCGLRVVAEKTIGTQQTNENYLNMCPPGVARELRQQLSEAEMQVGPHLMAVAVRD